MILFLFLFFSPFFLSIIDAAECGFVLGRHLNRPRRMIIGGTEVTEEGVWPWQVSLLKYNETEDRWKWAGCGGSLIGDHWAVTAAHCFKKGPIVANYSVLIGATHATIEDDSNQVRLIINVIRHPTYEKDDPNNDDIALLELEPSNSINLPIVPVCIPSKEQIVPLDIKAVSTGYGVSAHYYFDERNTVTTDMKLRQTTLTIHSLLHCGRENQIELRNPPRGVDLGICAGDIGNGPQRGDSGGPLMMKANDGRWIQIGINSYSAYKESEIPRNSPHSPPTALPYSEEEGSGEGSGDGRATELIEEGSGEVLTDKDEEPIVREEIRYVRNRSSFTKLYAYCDWIEKETKGEVKCLDEELTFQEPPNFSDFSAIN